MPQPRLRQRRGAVLVLAALLMVMIFGFAAFSVDVGYIALLKQELQNAADASALSAARELGNSADLVLTAATEVAAENFAGQEPVALTGGDVEIGVFNIVTREFTTTETGANAVRITSRVFGRPLFFGSVLGQDAVDLTASAIAMLNPRDIVFVVDLSGSMNDDTEPCWATTTINDTYGPQGYPGIGDDLMQDLYNDLGFCGYPGAWQHIGQGLDIPLDRYAYAEMTRDDGPLTSSSYSYYYRIHNDDSESERKKHAYRWIIDNQLATLMPNAIPFPDSSNTASYSYWEKYLDYVIDDVWVGQYDDTPTSGGGGGGGTSSPPPPSPPSGKLFDRSLWQGLVQHRTRDLGLVAAGDLLPALRLLNESRVNAIVSTPGLPRRGTNAGYSVPPAKDQDEIDNFNNPNKATFPSASSSLPDQWEFKVGYITYAQYLMDWGRDRSPLHSNSANADPAALPKLPLSLASGLSPMHNEDTAGGTFSFPPREQPVHAVRRALIAALQEVQTRNALLQPDAGDQVAIVTFDGLDTYHTPNVLVPLTSDFATAMQACTTMQAVSDIGNTTATEAGLILASEHVKDVADGGHGRPFADNVIILITDGVPNAIQSTPTQVNAYLTENASPEWYAANYWWLNAPLAHTHQIRQEKCFVYAVGMGLGTDYDFMDRLARLGGTDENGLSPRGSGNPAEYEQVLTDVINKIIRNPGARIVQ